VFFYSFFVCQHHETQRLHNFKIIGKIEIIENHVFQLFQIDLKPEIIQNIFVLLFLFVFLCFTRLLDVFSLWF